MKRTVFVANIILLVFLIIFNGSNAYDVVKTNSTNLTSQNNSGAPYGKAICGNNICEGGEASLQGGCGPNADPRCLGPPASEGTCQQDCKYYCINDDDCLLANPSVIASCPQCHSCGEIDYGNSQFETVNEGWLTYKLAACPPKNPNTLCPACPSNIKYPPEYEAKCINNECKKINVRNTTSYTPPVCGNNICESGEEPWHTESCAQENAPWCQSNYPGPCPQDCPNAPGTGKVKILPETASETAIAKLGQLGFNIILKEVGTGNKTKAIYYLEAEKEYRILGIFKRNSFIEAQIDANTGEIIAVKKPWWAILTV
ncbi:MAG: PepSY domain-containing protein [Nanoarchaeota archaeon]|nr:PepSY domain-containing protein [Nanoarchaeota archaeon]